MNNKQLTYGQKMVGVSFNPSALPEVDRVKQLAAELIDIAESYHSNPKGKIQLIELAINQVILAQMAVVKLITFKD